MCPFEPIDCLIGLIRGIIGLIGVICGPNSTIGLKSLICVTSDLTYLIAGLICLISSLIGLYLYCLIISLISLIRCLIGLSDGPIG